MFGDEKESKMSKRKSAPKKASVKSKAAAQPKPNPTITESLIISEDDFNATYPLIRNHIDRRACWTVGEGGGCMFETFGDEMEFVSRQDPQTIWTLVDGGDGNECLLSGYHWVNRLGYLISSVPFPCGVCIEVTLD
jgi:hypothetical protein